MVVSLLLARGDTVAPSRLYTRLCHAFLVLFFDAFITKNIFVVYAESLCYRLICSDFKAFNILSMRC